MSSDTWSITCAGAFALLHAALVHCPLLTKVKLRGERLTWEEVERLEGIVRALRGETRILKFFPDIPGAFGGEEGDQE